MQVASPSLLGIPSEARLLIFQHLFAGSSVRIQYDEAGQQYTKDKSRPFANKSVKTNKLGQHIIRLPHLSYLFNLSAYHPEVTQTCKLLREESLDVLCANFTLQVGDLHISCDEFGRCDFIADFQDLGFPPYFLERLQRLRLDARAADEWVYWPKLAQLPSLKALEFDGNYVEPQLVQRLRFVIDKNTTCVQVLDYWHRWLDCEFLKPLLEAYMEEVVGLEREGVTIRCFVEFEKTCKGHSRTALSATIDVIVNAVFSIQHFGDEAECGMCKERVG